MSDERTYRDGVVAALAACRIELNQARGSLHVADGEARGQYIVEMYAIYMCMERIEGLIEKEYRS